MILFLEGLPGVGKTTLVNKIKSLDLPNVHVVDEIITDVKQGEKQAKWLLNDYNKITKYNDGFIIIDRGLISTLSYNETLNIIKNNLDIDEVTNFFDKYKDIYNNSVIYYLKRKNNNYYLPFVDKDNPYGSIENQKLLEEITIGNCKKYCKNFNIVDYDYEDCEVLTNEIINKYLRS